MRNSKKYSSVNLKFKILNIFIAYDHQMTTVQVFMNGLMVADKNMVTNIMGASGNAMAIYYKASGGTIKQTELPIYGASRVGVYMKAPIPSNDVKNYQITDHLGNVRAVAQRSAFGGSIVSTLSYADYYPFGEQLQGRSSASNYRYAYQGQELDQETGMEAFQLRMWDGRLGRWLSPDPYGQYASPYLGMGNDPVNGIDPDGGWKTKFGAWWHGLWDGRDGEIFKSEEKGGWGIKYTEVIKNGSGNRLNEIVFTTTFGCKRYNNNGYASVTNVFNSGGINSNSVPCVKCHHDAIASLPSLPNINLDFLKPSSGYIMYGVNRRGIIAFGTVAGGAGAALTGGNFWQGAVTGLVVSGLNHFAHKISSNIQFKKTLRGILNDAGINPDDIPMYQVEEANCVIERAFSSMYKEAGSPTITNGDLGKRVSGRFEYSLMKDLKSGRYVGNSKAKGNITLSQLAYKNYLQLASTIGHELTHAIDYTKGYFVKWMNMGGETYMETMTELNAHEWQISVDAPYNSKRYENYYFKMHGND